jgi:cysteine synthase
MTALISSSLDDLIGHTPMLELSYPDMPPSVRMLAKLEMCNPMSSVKDRPALNMLREAERSGLLRRGGGTVVEYSSGNMGIALAALCAARGYRYILVMPDNATQERRQIVRAFGAQIVLTPHEDGLPAAIARACEITRSIPGAWLVDQSRNPDNTAAHYETTAPEIWAACDGTVDVFVCAVGTGGTLTGVARYLQQRRTVHVVAVEPAGSPVLSGGQSGPHRIPGIGPGFVADTTDARCIDEVVAVGDEDAGRATREIALRFGLLVGVSAGAAAYASRIIARRPQWAGATLVTVFPDSGERYLSIWNDLGAPAAGDRSAALRNQSAELLKHATEPAKEHDSQ